MDSSTTLKSALCQNSVFAFFMGFLIAAQTLSRCACAYTSSCQSQIQTTPEPKAKGIFRGLSLSEFTEVRDFVLNATSLRAVPSSSATLSSNYIFLIEDHLPKKTDILTHQTQPVGSAPMRRAKVVMFMGAEQPKTVREYLVYPVPSPHTIEPIVYDQEITWKSRPLCPQVERSVAVRFIENALQPIKRVLFESFGQWLGDGCSDSNRCLFYAILPRAAPASSDRHLQVLFYHSPNTVDGFFLYPVPFTLILHTPNNGDYFSVRYVYYNDHRFTSLDSLLAAYDSGAVGKVRMSQHAKYAKVYGSPTRRGPQTVPPGMRPPRPVLPDGQRFAITDGRHVNYLGWSFDVYFRTVSGVQLFNIKYMGENVAFEVSMQTISVLYGALEPENLFRSYYDDGFVLGTLTFPLVRGIDCPSHAAYLDSVVYSPGSDEAQVMKDAACLFEHVNSVPLRRHYDNMTQFSMPDAVLVVRQVLTVGNYDYVFDYEFHQTGVIETKVSSTGYVAATNNPQQRYGLLLNRDHQVNANVHVHAFHFKFDIDVATPTNRLVSIDMESEETTNPLSHFSWKQMKIQQYLIATEKEAAAHYSLPVPKYYLLQSPAINKLGYRRSYRVFSHNFAQLPLKDTSPFMDAASWIRHGLAVTVRKDSEHTTASLYTQGDPFNPLMDIERYMADDESIVDRDLVVWATVVMYHVPSAEDIPVTTTPGKTLGVTLAPFNFFDEDPSIASDDATVINLWNKTSTTDGLRHCSSAKQIARTSPF